MVCFTETTLNVPLTHHPLRLEGLIGTLTCVPDLTQTQNLVAQLHKTVPPDSLLNPVSLAETFGLSLKMKPVGDVNSAVLSVLVPLLSGGFRVVLNSHKDFTADEVLQLVGHELGHTLFYAPGKPPTRVIPGSAAEEKFCDLFANLLLAE